MSPNKQVQIIEEKRGAKSPPLNGSGQRKKSPTSSSAKTKNFNFQPEGKVPSFVRNSPRWQKLHALEKDIEIMASNSLQFDKFLERLHRAIKDDMQTMRMEQAEEDDRRNKMEHFENPQTSSPTKTIRSRKSSKSGQQSPDASRNQVVNADNLQIVDESEQVLLKESKTITPRSVSLLCPGSQENERKYDT